MSGYCLESMSENMQEKIEPYLNQTKFINFINTLSPLKNYPLLAMQLSLGIYNLNRGELNKAKAYFDKVKSGLDEVTADKQFKEFLVVFNCLVDMTEAKLVKL